MTKFVIPEEGLRGIRLLLDLDADRLNALLRAIEATGPVLMASEARAVLIEEALEGDHIDHIVDILATAIQPLHILRQQTEMSAAAFYATIGASAARSGAPHWNQESDNRWMELKPQLVALLDSKALSVEAKAFRLIRARPNVVQSLRIFSDVRPIFDESRKRVVAQAIINTLRVRYLDGNDSKTIHLSIDPDDLNDIEEQVRRAIQKNNEIVQLSEKSGLRTLMFAVEADSTDEGDEQ